MAKYNSAVRAAPTLATRAVLLFGAAIGLVATPAYAQIRIGVDSGLSPNDICLGSPSDSTYVFVSGSRDDCVFAGSVEPGFLQIGPDSSYALFDADTGQSTFTGTATFNNHVQMNGTQTFAGNSLFQGSVSFQGSSVTFATPTFFTFPSTFQAATTFNGGITSNNINNSGTINSTNVNVTGSLTAAPGTNINFGGVNQVHGVAAGAINATSLDAINGSQIHTILVNQDARDDGQDAAITAISLAIAENVYIAINSTGPAATATGDDAIAIGERATATHANSVAIGAGTATTAANQVNVGGRTISGVAPGALNATSTDAVNGSQLFATNTTVSTHTTQIAALQATDTALGGRITTLELLAVEFDEDLDRVDDRASAGSAAAIALSGGMFLPNKSFNLTGNVGAYRGAVAGAVQIGALVGENMAFNAGVAHGFNKGGKTGVRAGFTIGW